MSDFLEMITLDDKKIISINNYKALIDELNYYNKYYNRNISLVIVSKTITIDYILNLHHNTKQLEFAENYIMELYQKWQQLQLIQTYSNNIIWHFIGTIQTNKIKYLIPTVSWIHTLTKTSHAVKLNELLKEYNKQNNIGSNVNIDNYTHNIHKTKIINVLIQVNISKELHKNGLIKFEEIYNLALSIMQLPFLCFRGLMTIASNNEATQVALEFEQAAQIYDRLKQTLLNQNYNIQMIDTLSMGMSNDYHLAMQYGSTMLRIGSKIFKR